MHMKETLIKPLKHLKEVLLQNGENDSGEMVERVLGGTDEDVINFLKSNELWGGAGSIADQAGSENGRAIKRTIESALITLGEQQMQAGIVNERTGMWVDAFQDWKRNGI